MIYLALGKYHTGESDACRELVEKVVSLEPDSAAVLYNAACAYCHLGEHKKALDYLERLHGLGWNHPVWLDSDLDLEAVRDHPRFKALRAVFDA